MGESSIPCTEPTRDRLKALRGGGYKNWDTFLNELADAWEARFDGSMENDGGDLPDGLDERLERIESAASTAEERTGSIENTLEDAGLGR